MRLNPYLNFNGNCEEAFKFYEKCLGGKITAMMNHTHMPASENLSPDWANKIIHARLVVDGTILMGSDGMPNHYNKPQGFSVTLNFDKADEADRVFNALSEGGTISMPIDKTFFAVRFGMLTDRFGIPWMIVCEGNA